MQVPLFPLNAVLFPGTTVPLHVFEERYRALVRDLLTQPSPADRVFAVAAIREGYEVGEHGVQSLHRVGTLVQLTEAARLPDGRYDIEVTGRSVVRVRQLHPRGEYLRADVDAVEGVEESVPDTVLATARAQFERYRAGLIRLRGEDPFPPVFPTDPTYLSYALAACVLLPLRERQELLEADTAADRLALLGGLLGEELRAMAAISSLPATELARSRWSPN